MEDFIQDAVLSDPRSISEKSQDHVHDTTYSGLPVTWVEKPMTSWVTTSQRNQDGSFSCVAQSSATAVEKLTKNVISAANYQLRTNKPGEGMFLQNMGDISKNQGTILESLVPSQKIGDPQLDSIVLPPLTIKITGYRTFNTIDIDLIAQAIQAYGNCLLIFSSNPAEWQRTPVYLGGETTFGHCICATDFTLIKGVKTLICMDSAGQYSSPTGLRLITEDFLTKRCRGAMYYLGVLIGQNQPPVAFNVDLKYGDSGPEVSKLQEYLVCKGYLVIPPGTSYGFYGPLTKNAVFQLQLKYGILGNNGFNFGPRTRLVINSQS